MIIINSKLKKFYNDVKTNIENNGNAKKFIELSNMWNIMSIKHKYSYNFSWLGRPIIQIPQDIYIIQELIWKIKPDLIIETGIAHGGSLILSASMLALLDYSDVIKSGTMLSPCDSKREVLGIDINIREHNYKAIKEHPMSYNITMIEGSSDDSDIIDSVSEIAEYHDKVLVFLDSNHTHKHVLAELNAYAPLTSIGSYCVVWDSLIEDLPDNFYNNRPWGKGNNPKTAIHEFLKNTDCFEIDKKIENKLMITASPDGFLKRLK